MALFRLSNSGLVKPKVKFRTKAVKTLLKSGCIDELEVQTHNILQILEVFERNKQINFDWRFIDCVYHNFQAFVIFKNPMFCKRLSKNYIKSIK